MSRAGNHAQQPEEAAMTESDSTEQRQEKACVFRGEIISNGHEHHGLCEQVTPVSSRQGAVKIGLHSRGMVTR